MLTRVLVENFQSIRRADIELAKFVVVVGPSNSGKSAFLRAVRTLAENASSSSFVSTGQRAARISVVTDEETGVSLERGKALSTYRVATPEGEAVYAKAGTSVPEDVEKILHLACVEEESLSFAFQFDRPFLLSDPPTKVAKVLGDLTNINILFAATREANRRRLETQATLRVRRADLERLRERLTGYTDLPMKLKALEEARQQHRAVVARVVDVEALRTLLEESELCEQALEALPSLPATSADVEGVVGAVEWVEALRSVLEALEMDLQQVQQETKVIDELSARLASLDERYAALLREAGTCPVCGQSTTQAAEPGHVHAEV